MHKISFHKTIGNTTIPDKPFIHYTSTSNLKEAIDEVTHLKGFNKMVTIPGVMDPQYPFLSKQMLEDWTILPGQEIHVAIVPMGRDSVRIGLTLLLAVGAAYTGGLAAGALLGLGSSAAATATLLGVGLQFALVSGVVATAITLGGVALINNLVPPKKNNPTPLKTGEGPSPNYSYGDRGNYVRTGAAISKSYGSPWHYPDAIMQSYDRYINNELHRYTFLHVTQGEITNEEFYLGNRPFSALDEIRTFKYGPNNIIPNNVIQDNDNFEAIDVPESISLSETGRSDPITLYNGPPTTFNELSFDIRVSPDNGPRVSSTRQNRGTPVDDGRYYTWTTTYRLDYPSYSATNMSIVWTITRQNGQSTIQTATIPDQIYHGRPVFINRTCRNNNFVHGCTAPLGTIPASRGMSINDVRTSVDTSISDIVHISAVLIGTLNSSGITASRTILDRIDTPNLAVQTLFSGNTELNTEYQKLGISIARAGRALDSDFIDFDILFSRGLGLRNNDLSISDYSVTLEFQLVYTLDNENGETGTHTERRTITAGTETAQFRSFIIGNNAPNRSRWYSAVASVKRITPKSENRLVFDNVSWITLKAKEKFESFNTRNTTVYGIRAKATGELNRENFSKINVKYDNIVEVWNPTTEIYDKIITRNPCHAAEDFLRDQVHGMRLTPDLYDREGLARLAIEVETDEDEFNYVFDNQTQRSNALETILAVSNISWFRQNGVIYFYRDTLQEGFFTIVTPLEFLSGSFAYSGILTLNDYDGVIVTYADETRGGNLNNELYPNTSLSPLTVPAPGITNAAHARRYAKYIYNKDVFDRDFATITMSRQGLLLTRGHIIMIPITFFENAFFSKFDVRLTASPGIYHMNIINPPEDFLEKFNRMAFKKRDGSYTEELVLNPILYSVTKDLGTLRFNDEFLTPELLSHIARATTEEEPIAVFWHNEIPMTRYVVEETTVQDDETVIVSLHKYHEEVFTDDEDEQ